MSYGETRTGSERQKGTGSGLLAGELFFLSCDEKKALLRGVRRRKFERQVKGYTS